ncbi:MAG TPA: PAS domain-containing protein, partial [Ktedonobacteraceae bacterium]|nr:PAS domain-containing protein [Ktedonobacteraceae bacterium]
MKSFTPEEVEQLRARVLELEARERERERLEVALDEGRRLAVLIHDVSVALIQDRALQESLQQCAQALVIHLNAAFARVWTLNAETQMLELQASAGMYTHLDGAHSRVPVGTLKIGFIAAQKQPHLTNAVLGDPQVSDQEWAEREGMVAFAGYPLLVEGEVVGVMALFARIPLSTAVLDAMASVSNAIAIGIERKRIEAERVRVLEDAQRAAALAEAARQRLARILDNLPDGFMMFDEQWRYSYINPNAQPYTGKPWQDLLGKNVWEEFPELLGSPYDLHYHRAMLQQEPVAFELFSPALSGWFDIHAYPVPGGLAVYFRNITERKQVEEARLQLLATEQQAHADAEAAKQRVTAILESITDAFFALDTQWRFTYLNAQGASLLQRTREELLGKNVWEEFPEAVGS